MIKYENYRDNGSACPPVEREITVSEALVLMTKFELGYGGRVHSTSDTQVYIITQVLGCVDQVTFSGSKEEMFRLVAVARSHQLVMCDDKLVDAAISRLVQHLGDTPGAKGMSTFYFTAMAPILAGSSFTRIATLLGMGVATEDDAKFGAKLDLEVLVPLLELRLENPGMPLSQLAHELGVAA